MFVDVRSTHTFFTRILYAGHFHGIFKRDRESENVEMKKEYRKHIKNM